MPSLRTRVIEVLSRKPKNLDAVVPDELGHGVLRWGGDYLPFHALFHVRDEVVLHWNVNLPAAGGRGRAPLPPDLQEAVTRWMASITADELAGVSEQRLMRFVPRPVWAPPRP